MDPNIVHWNSALPMQQQQPAQISEGEIIARLIQYSAQMKIDGKDLTTNKQHH